MKNARRDQLSDDRAATGAAEKRRPGEPIKPTFLSVVVRSVLAIAVFVVLTTATGNKFTTVAPIAGVLFLLMVVLGYAFDKWFYRWRMRRWEAKRAGRSG